MCGIAGVLNLDFQRPADTQTLARMLDVLVHRGPDDQGRLVDGPLALGMRRLSIIDVAGSQQPIYNESGRYGVVFNGEIYNYRELRADLVGRGHQFKTKGDTEVIVHLFEEAGPACVDSLRGMYGFAVWDARQRQLFIARDRIGIKPLYYTVRNNTLIFASEIKALLEHPAVSPEIDPMALSDYLSLKYVPAPRTMFANINSLLPGHSLLVRNGRLEMSSYWDVPFVEPEAGGQAATVSAADESRYEERLYELLEESVRLRMRCDVPFGAFLSGGVDSSIIVALMSQILDKPVKTFSVGFSSDRGRDELPYARAVAQRFGTDHHEIVVRPQDFVEHSERVMWHLDQPIADQATIATFMVAKLAAEHVKMVCTGEGGDELFAGYARYQGEQMSPWSRFLPASLGNAVRRGLPYLPGLRRPKIAMHALTYRDEATRFANWFPLFNSVSKYEVMSAALRDLVRGHDVRNVFATCLDSTSAERPLNRMLYADSKLWLVDYLLLRGDKLTMANSLEARVPLLDHKLVEFAASLPCALKLHGAVRKYLLKKVGKRWLPDNIIHRRKEGFTIPIEQWFRNEARELVRDTLAPDTLSRRGLFDADYVQRLIRQHEVGYADHGAQLWGLMSVEMWLQKFVDHSPAADTNDGSLTAHAEATG